MRLVVRLLFLLAMAVPSLAAENVTFVRVWPGWRDADSFERIAEYFTGREEHDHRIVLRTTPDARAGFYYLVRVKNATDAITGAKFVLQVVGPDSPDTKTHTFATSLPAGTSVYQLGLTGPEWPDPKAHPVAWKLDLAASDGSVLASEQSFLWSKPTAK